MKIFLTTLLLIFISTGCTERVTKQFIVPEIGEQPDIKQIENWYIAPPSLIAFKNKKKSDFSSESEIYWLTMRAFMEPNSNIDNTLNIDSVGIEFTEIDSLFWRTPSRVAPYTKSKNKFIAFDFFKDKGILIPDYITKVRLFFDVWISDGRLNDNMDTLHKVSFDMMRQDTTQNTLFMIQE